MIYNSTIERNLMKIVKVDMTTDLQKAISEAKTPYEDRKVVFDYIMNEMRGVYISCDGIEITISSRTAKKYVNNAFEAKLRAAPHIIEMLQHSEFVCIVDANHKRYSKFIYYKTNFDVDGKIYSAIINVGIASGNKAILYDINQIKEQ